MPAITGADPSGTCAAGTTVAAVASPHALQLTGHSRRVDTAAAPEHCPSCFQRPHVGFESTHPAGAAAAGGGTVGTGTLVALAAGTTVAAVAAAPVPPVIQWTSA